MKVVLASSSPYRRELLKRFQISFTYFSPKIDETPIPGEDIDALVSRLAIEKAGAYVNYIANLENQINLKNLQNSGVLVIGSDQALTLDSKILGKPLNHQNAVAQLQQLSGRVVFFKTAVALLHYPSGDIKSRVCQTEVKFRKLCINEIEKYLEKEPSYDCAGSAKSEGLGITLLEYIKGDDPNALIGLPLIALNQLMLDFGYSALCS